MKHDQLGRSIYRGEIMEKIDGIKKHCETLLPNRECP